MLESGEIFAVGVERDEPSELPGVAPGEPNELLRAAPEELGEVSGAKLVGPVDETDAKPVDPSAVIGAKCQGSVRVESTGTVRAERSGSVEEACATRGASIDPSSVSGAALIADVPATATDAKGVAGASIVPLVGVTFARLVECAAGILRTLVGRVWLWEERCDELLYLPFALAANPRKPLLVVLLGQVGLDQHQRSQVDAPLDEQVEGARETPNQSRCAHTLVRHVFAESQPLNAELERRRYREFAIELALVELAEEQHELGLGKLLLPVQLQELGNNPMIRQPANRTKACSRTHYGILG